MTHREQLHVPAAAEEVTSASLPGGAGPNPMKMVVGNGGGTPEITRMAGALAREGLLKAYVAPFSPVKSELERPIPWLPSPMQRFVRREFARRVVDDAVASTSRVSAGRFREVVATAGLRAGLPRTLRRQLYRWRSAEVERLVVAQLRAADLGVIVSSGTAQDPLRKARDLGIAGWLDCPTAHHVYAQTLLAEEAKLVPEYAGTLQFVAGTEDERLRIDAEIELATDLIVLSSFQERTFLSAGVDPARMHVLHLGVDTDMFRPLPRVRDDHFTIGFVGQVTQRKGLSYLIQAHRALRSDGVRLLIVGRKVGGPHSWDDGTVEHHGPVPRWELSDYYARMDVFVLPSLIEGFPQTALEAMSCGVPVIVSENTFGHDVIVDGTNGYVIPIRDVDAIVDRVRLLKADDELRRAMSLEARRTAEAFSWGAFGRRLTTMVKRP